MYISQGSVATPLRCGGTFTNSLLLILQRVCPPVKEFYKSVNIWQRDGQYQVGRLHMCLY